MADHPVESSNSIFAVLGELNQVLSSLDLSGLDGFGASEWSDKACEVDPSHFLDGSCGFPDACGSEKDGDFSREAPGGGSGDGIGCGPEVGP